MDKDIISKRVLYVELTEGKRNQCQPRIQFKECIKADTVKCELERKGAKDRLRLRNVVRKGGERLKQNMIGGTP